MEESKTAAQSKLSQFELRVSPIAAGNSKLAAVTIIPNQEWLAEYKSTNEKYGYF